jgi:hypothetical protein
MMVILAFVSGVAFSAILLLAWSLCRVGADADERAQRIFEQEDNDAQQL